MHAFSALLDTRIVSPPERRPAVEPILRDTFRRHSAVAGHARLAFAVTQAPAFRLTESKL